MMSLFIAPNSLTHFPTRCSKEQQNTATAKEEQEKCAPTANDAGTSEELLGELMDLQEVTIRSALEMK